MVSVHANEASLKKLKEVGGEVMEEKKIGDLVSPLDRFPKIPINASLKDAILAMACAGRSRVAIIVDFKNQAVGLVTLRDLFKALEPRFARPVIGFGLLDLNNWATPPLFWKGLLKERCQKAAEIKIEEVVTPIRVVAVQGKDSLIQALHAMQRTKLDFLPVVEGDRVVGLLEAPVVFDEIARLTNTCAG